MNLDKQAKKDLKKRIKKEKQEVKDSNTYIKSQNKALEKIEKDEIKQEKYEANAPKREAIKKKNEAPHLTVLEEIGNSVVHGIGSLLGIYGLVLLLLESNSTIKAVSAWIYALSIIIMLLMSSLYHAFKWGTKVKRIWRRFDYSCIYLLIGGTFTPILLVYLQNMLGYIWFFVMWSLIITGITIISVFGPGRVKWIHYTLYFVLGWSGLSFIPIFIINDSVPLLLWILGGGLTYTLGMIPFAKKGVKSAHFIWHFFVVAGAVVQFLGILFYIY